MPTERYEYAVVDVRANARSIEIALNEAAEEGFRFVSVLSADADGHFVIMERHREADRPPAADDLSG